MSESAAAEVQEGPAWARGFEVGYLKKVTALFASVDKGIVRGAFTKVNEAMVAEWLSDSNVSVRIKDGEPVAAVAWKRLKKPAAVKDFSDVARAWPKAGDVVVSRLGWRDSPQAAHDLLRDLKPFPANSLWVWAWVESASSKHLLTALGMEPALVKVRASSELSALWVEPASFSSYQHVLEAEERATLVRLRSGLDVQPLLAAVRALAPSFAEHYSSYNKGGWSALALRGFAPMDCVASPSFIEKPSEMGKKWRRENAEKLSWEPTNSPLRSALPEAEPLLRAMLTNEGRSAPPEAFERIRLMKLGPGGGELARHADITDTDAGVASGKFARIHIPLCTNPDVQFQQWRLDGTLVQAHMAAGEMWYLDTRKPHRAWNKGDSERIHLVADVAAGEWLREQIRNGAEALPA